MLDFVLQVFDFMKNNGIEIDEKTCTIHLLALKSCDLLLFTSNSKSNRIKQNL